MILNRGLNINDKRRLDVEAEVLNPRRANNDKDVPAALQEWRQDQGRLIEAGCDHANRRLKDEGGHLAITILVKIMLVEGKNTPAAASQGVFGKSSEYIDQPATPTSVQNIALYCNCNYIEGQ